MTAEREKILGHVVEPAALLCAHLCKSLSGQVDSNDMMGFGKDRKQVAEALRGSACAVDQQACRTLAGFLHMPAMGAMEDEPRMLGQRPILGVNGPAQGSVSENSGDGLG